MRIEGASRRVVHLWLAGLALTAAAGVLVVVSALKSIYAAGAGDDLNTIIPLGVGIRRIISEIYPRHDATLWLWRAAPAFTVDRLHTAGNYGVFFLAGLLLAGSQMIGSARHLSGRVARAYERVEDSTWDEALRGQRGQPSSGVAQADVLALHIELAPEDDWYKRPLGIVALAVLGTVCAAWITLKLGLTK